ncbi:MAG: 30S ribosomal protein S6 [Planctomycetes bacterium]|jgi:small subunit ribosomal protein S6|nr:30S ribosomal protein S6 [Planctomycetota bacterium]
MATHIRQYEAMFLLNAGYASGNWEAAKAEVEHILHRANAEILHIRKWDERRLAYSIKGQKRGVYVLTFFKAEGPKIAGIERDAQLSENILRVLVIKADHLALKDVEAMVPQQPIQDDHFGHHTSRRMDRDSAPAPALTLEPVVDAIEGTVSVIEVADDK